ncbi:MAG: SGNH/GDSL hydrolase family protein, partial [Candidatus Hydrogenedens sp.]
MPTPNYKKGENKHNSYGFRGEELSNKKEGEIWIACLGESTTYDSDLECWEKAYPAQLERYLNEQGIKAKVINTGVDGWTSFEILIDFNLRVSRLPIDIIIYYGGFNDIIFTRLVYPIPEK